MDGMFKLEKFGGLSVTYPDSREVPTTPHACMHDLARTSFLRMSWWVRQPPAPGAATTRLASAVECTYRAATLDDLPELLALEEFQPIVHRSSETTLRHRLRTYPIGQLVAVAPDRSTINAALYAQRVESRRSLLTARRSTESALHKPAGPVLQLLAIVQRPSAAKGEGDRLRRYALQLARADATIMQVCVVGRCREFDPKKGKQFRAHVDEGSDIGLLFHSLAGATIGEIVSEYNANDTANLGHGVFMSYYDQSVNGATTVDLAKPRRETSASSWQGQSPLERRPWHLAGACTRWAGSTASAGRGVVPAGGDAVSQVPLQRWELDLSSTLPSSRHMAAVAGADRFDHQIFGISSAESSAMDPQQQLLLEHGYAACHAVGHRRASLTGAELAVFLGIMNADYARSSDAASVYKATGGALSIAAGRLSFVLGVRGPCVSYDTACASALVALHGASSALSCRECDDVALTLAVSLMLSPQTHQVYARAGMLSDDGRCKTFDASANGYARGEGVGALTVGAGSVQAGYQHAPPSVLAGCAVRSDGRSASLTAPNGTAQSSLIRAALAVGGGGALRFIETHGTGTALGDPTEVRGLQSALGPAAGFEDANALANGLCLVLGASKASFGHTEPAAGLLGLVALIRAHAHGSAPPNAKLRVLNPRLRGSLTILAATVSAQSKRLLRARPRRECMAAEGVSSFGYSGTIAHAVVLELSRPPTERLMTASPAALVYRRRCFGWPGEVLDLASSGSPHDDGSVGEHAYRLSWECVRPRQPPHAAFWMLGRCVSTSAKRHAIAPQLVGHAMHPGVLGLAMAVSSEASASELPCLEAALAAVQAAACCGLRAASAVWMLSAVSAAGCSPEQQPGGMGSLWGIARSSRSEAPSFDLGCLGVHGSAARPLGLLGKGHAHVFGSGYSMLGMLELDTTGREATLRDGQLRLPRLRRAEMPPPLSAVPATTGPSAQLLTGGTGGLGLVTARWLSITLHRTTVVLVSRSGWLGAQGQSELQASRGLVARANVAEAAEMRRVVVSLAAPPLRGIWHAAGVLADALLGQQCSALLQRVAAPKSHAAELLLGIAAARKVDACMLFSSVTALLGGAGQANYSAANSALDAIACARQASAQRAGSVQWGPWATVGMASRDGATGAIARRWRMLGYGLISTEQGAAALAAAVHPLAPAVLAIIPADWRAILRQVPGLRTFLDGMVASPPPRHAHRARASKPDSSSSRPSLGTAAVLNLAAASMPAGAATLSADARLLECGFDSLGEVELRHQLQAAAELSEELPSRLLLDHPTARQLAAHLAWLAAEARDSAEEEAWPGPHAASATASFAARPGTSSAARLMMLHGNAGDAALMKLQLQASGWWDVAQCVEFVCVTAPHACEPLPHLYEAFDERGLYSRDKYSCWGFDDAARTAHSVAFVQALLREHRCVGIGGICDGAIMAGLVALQTAEVEVYLNCCAGPWRGVPDNPLATLYLQAHPELELARIRMPSLHLLSAEDALFTFAQVYHRLRSDFPLI